MGPARTGRNLSQRKPLFLKDSVGSNLDRQRWAAPPGRLRKGAKRYDFRLWKLSHPGTESRSGLLPGRQNR